MFDEASDINMHSNLNVFVNVLLPSFRVQTLTLTLTELPGADAATVYSVLLGVLREYNVPLHKVIGICSDGAKTMQGVHRGVCTQLARYIRDIRQQYITAIRTEVHGRSLESFHHSKGLYVVHCVCHRLALILTDAIKGTKAYDKVIPDEVIDLLSLLYTYFSKSPARKAKLRTFIQSENQRRAAQGEEGGPQARPLVNPDDELTDVLAVLEERYKLPRRIVLTRWLSSAEAVRVALICRDTYATFFMYETSETGEQINDLLQDNTIIAWYACLMDVLPVLTGMNVLFQSTLPLPHLLYDRVMAAKNVLINMVGQGPARTALIGVEEINLYTPFGAFANKFVNDNSEGRHGLHGMSLRPNEILALKKDWHKFYKHCIEQIDARFPVSSMEMFQLLQVINPAKICGPSVTRITRIAGEDLLDVVQKLLIIFELPLRAAAAYTPEEILNSFTAFRVMDRSVELWAAYARQEPNKFFNHAVVYTYYKECMDIPGLGPWSFFALFLLVLPTGNAISERGFSAQNATHSKQRSELSHDQTLATMMIGFNGPELPEFVNDMQRDSKSLGRDWWGFIPPCNYNAT